MTDMMLTVFTPTYNRAGLLGRVYESLQRQDFTDFEWLIVDDGSTDDTQQTVRRLIEDSAIEIRYIRKENGGKHTAHNVALENAAGDWFLCLDSDDYLAEGALSALAEKIGRLPEDASGIIARKATQDGRLLSESKPAQDRLYGFYDYVTAGGGAGEYTLVFRTEMAKAYPFPVIPGERFVTECVVYDRMDLDGHRHAILDKVLQICEYQADGLSSSIYQTLRNNPTGYQIYHAQRIDLVKTAKERLRHAIGHRAFRTLSGNKDYRYQGNHRLLVAAMALPGLLGAVYYRYQMR